jgi:hypothetical protein
MDRLHRASQRRASTTTGCLVLSVAVAPFVYLVTNNAIKCRAVGADIARMDAPQQDELLRARPRLTHSLSQVMTICLCATRHNV